MPVQLDGIRSAQEVRGMVWAAIVSAVALAGDITVDLPFGSELGTCTPDLDAECWELAPRADRFAAAAGIATASRMADVRLAHRHGRLLVRVTDLMDGERVQVVVDPDPIRRATSTVIGPGVTEIPVAPSLVPGTVRRVSLAILRPEAEDRAPLYASPAGPGAGWRVPDFLVVDGDPSGRTVRVHSDGDNLVVEADGAQIEVLEDSDGTRVQRRDEGSPAWTATGRSPLVVPGPPGDGWYDVVATWGSEDDARGRQVRRIRWEATPPESLQHLGLHPRPREVVPGRGRYKLKEGAAIAVLEPAFVSAATLLSQEIERLAGHQVPVVERPPERGDLWIGAGPPRGSMVAWPDGVPTEDGFRLRLTARDAGVAASDLSGAVYGALALADLLAADGSAGAMQVVDWPDVRRRVLYHRVDSATGPIDPDLYVTFLRRVVARGRYDTLVLTLRGAYRYQSHPELTRRGAWSHDDLSKVLEAARDLGMEVVPGLNSPGHAQWITGSHPELMEDGNRRLVCTRHPGTRALIEDVTTELMEVFGDPSYVHVGHDEVFWRTEALYDGPERCPRCAGTPRWQLVAEHMAWTIDDLSERDARPIFWADMFVEDWNGRAEGVFRSLALLSDEQRQQAVFMSWAGIGSPVRTLADQGLETWWGMTGNYDERRESLGEVPVQAATVALFYATPWSAFSTVLGDRRLLGFHWSRVIHGGAALWRSELVAPPVDTALREVATLPAYQPGRVFLPVDKARPLPLDGQAPPEWVPAPVAGTEVTVGGVRYELAAVAADVRRPVTIDVDGAKHGVSLLLSGWLADTADAALRQASRSARDADGVPVAAVDITWADGETATVPLHWGIDLWSSDPDRGILALWGTAGTVRVRAPFSGEVGRQLWRWDLVNPRPDVSIQELSVQTHGEGTWVVVAAATGL